MKKCFRSSYVAENNINSYAHYIYTIMSIIYLICVMRSVLYMLMNAIVIDQPVSGQPVFFKIT